MEGLEFNVSQLLRQVTGASTEEIIDTGDSLCLEDVPTRRIRGGATLTRTNFGILARVVLRVEIALECDRCLERYPAALPVSFAEEYLPVIDVLTGRPVQSERTDDTFFISPNHIVDLSEAVRQHLLLSIPMHKVCREGCLGLCPICGANKNITGCECSEECTSPFSEIANLLMDATQSR